MGSPNPSSSEVALDLNTLPDHRGRMEHVRFLFFASPPAEIGALRSAESTVHYGRGPKPVAVRLGIGLGIGVILSVTITWLSSTPGDHSAFSFFQGRVLAPLPVGCVIAYFLTYFRGTCTFVGEQGIARVLIEGSLAKTPKFQVLLFEEAAELLTSETRRFVNGIYSGTSYDYFWNTVNGARIYRLKGDYHSKSSHPVPGHPWYFARAAELAWSMYFLERAEEILRTEGSVPFRVDRKRSVRVGVGFIEFHFGGDPVRVSREEIASISLFDGQFAFIHKDTRWFSRAGRYVFAYENMGNAKVFLLALDRLLGYRTE